MGAQGRQPGLVTSIRSEETFLSGVCESFEPGAEVVFAEAGGASERGDPRRVAEVARSETRRATLRRDLIALGRHVHSTTPARAAWIERIRKRDRRELASLNRHERAQSTLEKVDDGGISEIARILGFHGNRRRTSQLISNRLVDDRSP